MTVPGGVVRQVPVRPEEVPLAGRRVRLEPLRVRHTEALHHMASSPEWPFEGGDLPLLEFVAYVFSAGTRQFAVVRRDTDELIGLVQGANEDLRNGTIMVAFALRPEVWGSVWPVEAVVLYLRYLYEGCGFRKLYLEMTESTFERWGGRIDTWARLEGRNRSQARVGDHYEDVLIFGLPRDRWNPDLADRITGHRQASPEA